MVDKGEGGVIRAQGGVTNRVANVKCHDTVGAYHIYYPFPMLL